MIESSTGTGKTLSLLVSTLSWADKRYHETGNKTRVIYLSRAHSQLSQIAKELEKTPYRPHMILYGSREKVCINDNLIAQMRNQDNSQGNYNRWI